MVEEKFGGIFGFIFFLIPEMSATVHCLNSKIDFKKVDSGVTKYENV